MEEPNYVDEFKAGYRFEEGGPVEKGEDKGKCCREHECEVHFEDEYEVHECIHCSYYWKIQRL